MLGKATLTVLLIAAGSPALAGKAENKALLDAAIEDYAECNRQAMALATSIEGRSLGWQAVYAEGTCLDMLEPVNERMLELYIPDVTFYKIQNLRATRLRENMEQIYDK